MENFFFLFTIDSKISRLLGEAEASTIDFLANNFNTGKSKGIIFEVKVEKRKTETTKARVGFQTFKERPTSSRNELQLDGSPT